MKKNTAIRIIAGVIILISCFMTGFSAGYITENIAVIKSKTKAFSSRSISAELLMSGIQKDVSAQEQTDVLFKPFWEAWDTLHHFYVDQPLDDDALMEGAIRGMISALGDKHTRYSDPKAYQQEVDSMAGEYEGIGAYVSTAGEYVEISSPISGSPAEEAGLQPHDFVIAVDGVDQTGIDPDETLTHIRGPRGTEVTLTIRRGDADPFDVKIIRRAITSPMAEGKMLDDGIAYLQLTQFGDLSTKETRSALDELMKQKPKGLILDLRNNGGGYLVTAVEIASEFLPKGTLTLTEKGGNGEETEYHTQKSDGRALNVPMVVLVNQGSASASEILTGALKYHQRAVIIGMTTYGKGSVQIQPTLSNGGAVSVTIARWYTPGGELIHGVGITPDYQVDYTKDDFLNDRDPQLDAGVEFLLTGKVSENLLLKETTVEPTAEPTEEPLREETPEVKPDGMDL